MLESFIAALTLIAQPAAAEPSDIALRASGSGRWSVSCDFETERGTRRDRARGRSLSDFDTLRGPNAFSANCSYEAEEGARFVLRFLQADGFICPFNPEAEIDDCQVSLTGPVSGTFTIER